MAEPQDFEAVIGSFQVIDTSLRCLYAGEAHMYRGIAAQLRILLCDTSGRKDTAGTTCFPFSATLIEAKAGQMFSDKHQRSDQRGA